MTPAPAPFSADQWAPVFEEEAPRPQNERALRATERARAISLKHRAAARDGKIFRRIQRRAKKDIRAVQACWRGHKSRVLVRTMHRAAIAMQRQYRGFYARGLAQGHRARLDIAEREAKLRVERKKRLATLEKELDQLRNMSKEELAKRYEETNFKRTKKQFQHVEIKELPQPQLGDIDLDYEDYLVDKFRERNTSQMETDFDPELFEMYEYDEFENPVKRLDRIHKSLKIPWYPPPLDDESVKMREADEQKKIDELWGKFGQKDYSKLLDYIETVSNQLADPDHTKYKWPLPRRPEDLAAAYRAHDAAMRSALGENKWYLTRIDGLGVDVRDATVAFSDEPATDYDDDDASRVWYTWAMQDIERTWDKRAKERLAQGVDQKELDDDKARLQAAADRIEERAVIGSLGRWREGMAWAYEEQQTIDLWADQIAQEIDDEIALANGEHLSRLRRARKNAELYRHTAASLIQGAMRSYIQRHVRVNQQRQAKILSALETLVTNLAPDAPPTAKSHLKDVVQRLTTTQPAKKTPPAVIEEVTPDEQPAPPKIVGGEKSTPPTVVVVEEVEDTPAASVGILEPSPPSSSPRTTRPRRPGPISLDLSTIVDARDETKSPLTAEDVIIGGSTSATALSDTLSTSGFAPAPTTGSS